MSVPRDSPPSVERGAPCVYSNDCAPGLACVGPEGEPTSCNPYCDPTTSTGETACSSLCAGKYFTFDGYGICHAG